MHNLRAFHAEMAPSNLVDSTPTTNGVQRQHSQTFRPTSVQGQTRILHRTSVYLIVFRSLIAP